MRNDWGWLRWNRLRWRLVDALEHSAFHDTDGPMVSCDLDECCRELFELSKVFAVRLGSEDRMHTFMGFDEHSDYLVTEAMRDGIFMLSDLYSMRSLATARPFAGYLEIPEHVARILMSGHFMNLSGERSRYPGDDPFDNCRELVYALSELAFPDEYLEYLHGSGDESDPDDGANTSGLGSQTARVLHGWEAYGELRDRFGLAGYVAPLLCDEIVTDLTVDVHTRETNTPHFHLVWRPEAPYDLLCGAPDASLRNYWGDLPTLPWAFSYFEGGNEYGTGMCFIVRSPGIFVAQQVWDSSLSREQSTEVTVRAWDRCTAAYNRHLVPLLDTTTAEGAAMVVYSDFRNEAYIVSAVPASWDEYAPQSRVLMPLPDGWGITGVWRGHDEHRYTPPSLDGIVRAGYSDQITACARYLKECLEEA